MSRDWTKNRIKAELREKDINLAHIDRITGRRPGSASKALTQPWAFMQSQIAKHLNVDPWIIWPSRYDQDNYPIDRRGKHKKTQQRVGT